MKIYQKGILITLTSLFLASCSASHTHKTFGQNDILTVEDEKHKIQVSNKYKYLSTSNEVADSSTPFTQVKAFVPNELYAEELLVQNEPFLYLKVPPETNIIAGKLVYENATDEPMKIRSLFLQGNSVAKLKLNDSEEWKTSIEYEVKPRSSVSLDVEISWNNEGMQELTFFPLDQTSEASRYEGGSLSTYRFYVQSRDVDLSKQLLEMQSNKLSLDEIDESIDLFPVPTWLDESRKPIEYETVNEELVARKPFKFLKLAKVPYDTSVDLLIVDEFGNVEVLKEDINILKNKDTVIKISDINIQNSYEKDTREFLLILNNREEEILADLKTLDLRKKLFSTSYQGLIELFPYKSES